MNNTARRTAVAVLSAGALVLPLGLPASAASGDVSDPLAGGLVGPLKLSVASSGGVYVAEAFRGALTRIKRDGSTSVAAMAPEGAEIAGVDATRMAQAVYLTSGPTEDGFFAELRRLKANGKSSLLADLQAWEEQENPDGDVHYGFAANALTADCARLVPEWIGGGRGYDGIVESHPYGVTATPGGWVVADAAGNSLISVSRSGEVSTLAVLPVHTTKLTAGAIAAVNASLAEQNEPGQPELAPIPDCVAGADYAFESVPTDVELGPDGMLYVSTLAGGPEDPSLGARSKVFTVDRKTGEMAEYATGLFAATDLAVSPRGTIYVSELFAGQISRIVRGKPVQVAEVPLPAAVEWHRGMLYAAVDVFPGEQGPDGKVVMIEP